MSEGTLIVSRAVNLFPDIKKFYEEKGFKKVTVTDSEKDGLNRLISELDPELLIMDSKFYQAGTPYMMGEIKKVFPKLNTAAVSGEGYPLFLAVYFVWYGVKSYLDLWDGRKEFEKGLQIIRAGDEYRSPKLKAIIDAIEEPDMKDKLTIRLMECLIMLCCGFKNIRIGEYLHISKKTVECHLQNLYNIFNVNSREEMVSMAWRLGLITKDDMQFYDDRIIKIPLPRWAETKKLIDRR